MRRFQLFLALLWLGALAPAHACEMGKLYYVWVAFVAAGAGLSALIATGLGFAGMGSRRPSCLGGVMAILAGTLGGAFLGANASDIVPGLVRGLGGAAGTSVMALLFVRSLEDRAREADEAGPGLTPEG